MNNSREVALHILMKIEENKAFSNILLNSELKRAEINDLDKMFVTQLVYGVVANKYAIDHIIKKSSKIKFNKISVPILNILRLGVFQIYYLDKIPVSATCNESVKLSKKYGHISSANFVNAVLRNISRKNKDEFFEDIKDSLEYLSIYYSYPKWIIETWIKQFGKDGTTELLKANEKVDFECVRVNTIKANRDELLRRFDGSEKGKLSDVFYVKNVKDVLSSDEFKNGLVTLQDEAPALVAHLLSPKEKEEILDICAAPGGKTTHVAGLVNDNANIIAVELYPKRAELIEETARRLGINSIKVKVGDATEFCKEFENKFDKIIADVPCSGLGVIRKKPDIKFNIEKEDIDKINEIQKTILKIGRAHV